MNFTQRRTSSPRRRTGALAFGTSPRPTSKPGALAFGVSPRPRTRTSAMFAGLATAAVLALLPAGATAADGSVSAGGSGDSGGSKTWKTVPGKKAKLRRNGKAIPPAEAPRRVQRAIRAGNRIDDKPYRYGGGHGSWRDSGYDCSGAASYILGKKGAKLLSSPMPSSGFINWKQRGRGKWVTVYANSGHMFVKIAGLRFDTSQPDDGESGPGWSKDVRAGFANVSRSAARHPAKL